MVNQVYDVKYFVTKQMKVSAPNLKAAETQAKAIIKLQNQTLPEKDPAFLKEISLREDGK